MVQRYDVEHDYGSAWMESSDSGDYVTFDDYDNLCREYDDLKDKYDKLVEKLGSIYQEA